MSFVLSFGMRFFFFRLHCWICKMTFKLDSRNKVWLFCARCLEMLEMTKWSGSNITCCDIALLLFLNACININEPGQFSLDCSGFRNTSATNHIFLWCSRAPSPPWYPDLWEFWFVCGRGRRDSLHNLQRNLQFCFDMKHKMNQKGWPWSFSWLWKFW